MSSIKKKLVLDRTIKYKTPCIITLSGLPGSGKTTCAKVLSRNLKIFIVCNDFVRGYFNCSSQELDEKSRKKVDRKVFLFNIKRLIELFLNRVSIVLDSDINNLAKFKKVELLAKIFRYQIINIKINSIDDSINLTRIKNRINDNNDLDANIIGDNIKHTCYYEKDAYDAIKERKPQLLEDNFFDYVLDNSNDLVSYLNDLDKVCDDIMSKRLVMIRRNTNE